MPEEPLPGAIEFVFVIRTLDVLRINRLLVMSFTSEVTVITVQMFIFSNQNGCVHFCGEFNYENEYCLTQ